MSRGYGWIADPVGHASTPIHHLLNRIGASSSVPDTIDLRDAVENGPGILDQGATNSCVGHAIAAAVEVRMLLAGHKLPYHLSPVSVYDWARLIDQPTNALLFDVGCAPNEAVRGIQEWGIARYESRPTDNATINDKPKLAELESADGFKLRGTYRIDGSASMRGDLIQRALAAGVPVTAAMRVDEAFEQYSGGLYVPGGADKGGHCFYCVGVYTHDGGYRAYRWANSWNRLWGAAGYFETAEGLLDSMTDLNGLDVEVVE